MRIAIVLSALVLAVLPTTGRAGHTRAAYVDGCQSADGRFVVTAEHGTGGWTFTWKDTKEKKTHTGKLEGLRGIEHFVITYAHLFVAPDGETFAVWNPASFAADHRVAGKRDSANPAWRKDSAFGHRLTIYKKTGEVVKRLGMSDILKDNEWQFIHWVQANLYWLVEYADAYGKGAESPRVGYRYYRVSPDYTVLEFTLGPCNEMQQKLKSDKSDLVGYRRIVRVRLTDGHILGDGENLVDKDKAPVRPYVGEPIGKGNAKDHIPSLDPVRVPGKLVPRTNE